jgi:transcriptional regulator GlxA family with amidase domain
VLALVRAFAAADKPIAAVCHGAQLLAAADVISGRTVSAYPACAPEVKLAGARYADIAIDAAIADGNLVTAPAWPAHPAWLAKFLEERWLAKFGHVDKWNFCLRAAMMPRIRREDDEASAPNPRSGFQSEGGVGRGEGGEDAGRAGEAI